MFRFTGNVSQLSIRFETIKLLKNIDNLDFIISKIGPASIRHVSTVVENKTTCLIAFHKRRQAKLEPFAGYLMPIFYKNQTIKSEHMQTRDLASVFDVSHMMQTVIKGKDRYKFLERLTVADVETLGPNKCALSMITNESGGIIDDCIIGKLQNHIHLVSNAGNADVVWNWLKEKLDETFQVELERLVGQGLIALQGPRAAEVLQTLVDVKLSEFEFMSTFSTNIRDIGTCQVTRCGYTGEDGFEISVDAGRAEALMELLCQHDQVKPAGLGARDTLRLEAGLCLHGHDITANTTPVEAALNWTVHKRRRLEGGFIGCEKIIHQLKMGSELKRVGLIAVTPGPPAREHCPITELGGDSIIGNVTSGNFSPKLDKNIAMAYLPTRFATKYDQSVCCNIRGKKYEYRISKMPFVKSNYYFKFK